MDNTINSTIIEKVIIKSVAIYKAMDMLSQPPFEDKFKKETLCQQNENTQKQNLEKCLNEPEKRIEQPQNVDTNETKIVNELGNWRTITDPKLRKKAYKKHWKKVNRDWVLLQKKAWYQANKHKAKNYCINNKDRILRRSNLKYKTDIKHKLRVLLRSRLNKALNRNYKSGSAVRDLGCTVEELKSYLESKFLPGMTWDNYGLYGWHIDHIKPLASFDLSDRKQMLEACHYTNLQPLWANDNLSKNDKLNWCISQDKSPHE